MSVKEFNMQSNTQPSLQPKTARGQRTRQKLLAAAEEEFGLNGFNQTSVSNITKNAEVGQGTFYLYFNSKEEILRELVQQLGSSLREAISEGLNSKNANTQEEIEREGLRSFLKFVSEHGKFYRVIAESQFIDEAIFEDYYKGFGEAYRKRLEKAAQDGMVRPGNAEVRAWALMGMAQFLGKRYITWAKPGEDIDEVVDETVSILKNGFL